MSEDIFGFLGGESTVPLPEGSGVFANSGFIGALTAARLFKFWSSEDLELYDEKLKVGVDYYRRGSAGSWWYYFHNQEQAKASADLLKAFAPNQVWRFEMPTASVLNFQSEKALEAWGTAVSGDARVATLGSKYRHEYHLLALPAMVDALARRAGFIKEPIYHVTELLAGMPDEEFTDQFHWRMLGHPDATTKDDELLDLALTQNPNDPASIIEQVLAGDLVVEGKKVLLHYHFSELWQRRARLWAALGEPNVSAYLPVDTATTADGKKYETTSKNLSLCLGASTRQWVTPVWARLYLVPDPAVGATYKSKTTGATRRNTLPVVGELFADEAAARAAVGDEATATSATSSAVASNIPPVPEAWKEAAGYWRDELKARKAALNGVLPIMPKLLEMSKQLVATPEEIRAWWELV